MKLISARCVYCFEPRDLMHLFILVPNDVWKVVSSFWGKLLAFSLEEKIKEEILTSYLNPNKLKKWIKGLEIKKSNHKSLELMNVYLL